MEEKSSLIPLKRRSVETPKSLVNNGVAVFGAFNKEFENFNLEDTHNPTVLPDFMNSKRLTLWEAFEVRCKNGILVSGCCNMGIFGRLVNLYYDFSTKKVYSFGENTPPCDAVVSNNLLKEAKTEINSKKGYLEILNSFEKGEAGIKGLAVNHHGEKIDYSFELKKVSVPSIVVMPMGVNRPLYTEKCLFKVTGYLKIDDKDISLEDAYAIIDDHRGFYPYRTHYDWITFFGDDLPGELLGVNLTRNQSTDPENYNENFIFLKDSLSLIPPVTFSKKGDIRHFKDAKSTPLTWNITSKGDMVNLTCRIENVNKSLMQAVVSSLHYYIVHGKLDGYIRKEDGTKVELKDVPFIGEDKSVRF